jgi:hypothetical protein
MKKEVPNYIAISLECQKSEDKAYRSNMFATTIAHSRMEVGNFHSCDPDL